MLLHLALCDLPLSRQNVVDATLLAHAMRAVFVRPSAAIFPGTHSFLVLLHDRKTSTTFIALVFVERTFQPVLHLVKLCLIRFCNRPFFGCSPPG